MMTDTYRMGEEAHQNLMGANIDLRRQRDGLYGLKQATNDINAEINRGESLMTTITVK